MPDEKIIEQADMPDGRVAQTVQMPDGSETVRHVSQEEAHAAMGEDEFVRRFTAEAIRLAGFSTFDDGMPVSEYCAEVARSYYSDPLYREDGPEACAEGDVSYWGEE